MIIGLLGNIGSGKTTTIVKEIIDKKQYAFTNFNLKNMKKYYRIKVSDVILKGEKLKDYKVNWKFWENVRLKHENYSIYLDEIHNLIHSRRAMSRINILMSKWLSQIRKILNDHPTSHLYVISQTARKIDVDFRDLMQLVIECHKIQIKDKVYIKQYWYEGLDNYYENRSGLKKVFLANKYFKFFDSKELVTFTDSEDYI